MTNTINISGFIAPADLFGLRDILSPGSATFPQDVDAALRKCSTDEDITLRIDSPGGYCEAGNAMIIALRDWELATGHKVNVEVGAQAASMAACMMFSFSGTIKVHRNSLVMLHGARFDSFGETWVAEALRDAADSLDVINDIMIDTVAEKTGKPREEIAEWVRGSKETFFGARKLLDKQLIDGVIDAAPSATPVSPVALNAFSRLSACKCDGGILAAVAFASLNKEAVMADDDDKKPEEETPADTTPAEETPPAEEKPAEDTPPAEENPPAEEEKPAEEEEKPAEDNKALADTIASAVQEAVTVALADANAEIATLKAKLEAAELRAQKAEGTLRGITAARGKPLQLPTAPAAAPTASNDAKAEWQKAVREHGLQAAMKKFPDLLAAVRSAAK